MEIRLVKLSCLDVPFEKTVPMTGIEYRLHRQRYARIICLKTWNCQENAAPIIIAVAFLRWSMHSIMIVIIIVTVTVLLFCVGKTEVYVIKHYLSIELWCIQRDSGGSHRTQLISIHMNIGERTHSNARDLLLPVCYEIVK